MVTGHQIWRILTMAKTQVEADGKHNGFSILVKSKDDESGGKEKDKGTEGTADKYKKSLSSVGSLNSHQEIQTEVVTSESEDVVTLSPENKKEVESSQQETASKPVTTHRSNITFSNEKHTAGSLESGVETNAPDYVRSILLETKDKKFKHKRHSLWYRLRFRHIHMGVVEVNNDHPYYLRLQGISVGLRILQSDSELRSGPLENMETHHYSEVIDQHVTLEELDKKHTCVFETYAPAVFATIRRAVSVKEDLYMKSVISQDHAYLEFISNSRSGQDFFLSPDMRYLIKTNKEGDVKFLLSILEEYLQHFLAYPHSLVVKYLGCYAVQFKGKKKTYFLVMQNVFYPADRIEDRFDVKGCTAGRYQEPDPPRSQTITILKDQNFFQEELQLGVNRDWFIEQLTADSTFLKNLNVMDYSLLVGRQKIHTSERSTSLPRLVSRINRSKLILSTSKASQPGGSSGDLFPSLNPSTCLPSASTTSQLPGTVMSENPLPSNLRTSSLTQNLHASAAEEFSLPFQKGQLHFPHSLVVEEEFSLYPSISGRRRLLPDCTNALHVIDGPEYRYFFGIVDFLTQWTLKQKLARVWKEVKYVCGEHSTMPPDYYSQRFITFITNRTT